MMKTKTRSNTNVETKTDTVMEVGKVGMTLLLTFGVAVGILSFITLVAGAIKVGGIVPLLGMMFGVL